MASKHFASVAGAAAVGLAGVVMMSAGWPASVQVVGFWLLAAMLIGLAIYTAFFLLRRMVGRPQNDWTGDRELAIALAILVAAAVAPGAARDVEGVVIGLTRGLFVEGPQLASGKGAGVHAVAGLYRCIVDRRECLGAKAAAAQRALAGETPDSAKGEPVPPDSDWLLFLLAMFGMIMAARGLRGARYDYFLRPRTDAEAAATGEPRGLTGRSQVLMNYPTWVAFCVYALILAPATYLAIGSLLFLRMNAPSADLAGLNRTLAEAKARVVMPTYDVTRIRAGMNRLESPSVQDVKGDVRRDAAAGPPPPADAAPPAADRALREETAALAKRGRELATKAEALATGVAAAREGYEGKILDAAAEAKVQVTAPQFEDGREVQVARYESVLADLAKRLEACRDGLASVQAEQEQISAELNKAPGKPPVLKALTETVGAATAACDSRTLVEPIPPPWVGVSKVARARTPEEKAPPQFLETLYGWLASTSDSAVLIVGLVGFGLFGSAIRMMARPDAPSVDPEEVMKARAAALDARAATVAPAEARATGARELEAAQKRLRDATHRLAADEAGVAQAALTEVTAAFQRVDKTWREAEERARLAEAFHDQKRRALVEDRSSIVVRDDTPAGDYTISGAPARVLVQGVGAAFTSFLAGQAGLQVLSMGGRANAYTLLLTCFVGAVFAEEIWRWARRFLPDGAAPPPPAGGPPPPAAPR